MQSELQILQIADVVNLLRVSRPTLYRWLAESRKGAGRFPLPISQNGRKLLWNRCDIEIFCQSNARAAIEVPSPKRARGQAQRREDTERALKRHGINIERTGQ